MNPNCHALPGFNFHPKWKELERLSREEVFKRQAPVDIRSGYDKSYKRSVEQDFYESAERVTSVGVAVRSAIQRHRGIHAFRKGICARRHRFNWAIHRRIWHNNCRYGGYAGCATVVSFFHDLFVFNDANTLNSTCFVYPLNFTTTAFWLRMPGGSCGLSRPLDTDNHLGLRLWSAGHASGRCERYEKHYAHPLRYRDRGLSGP
jgi:hypothetical protein